MFENRGANKDSSSSSANALGSLSLHSGKCQTVSYGYTCHRIELSERYTHCETQLVRGTVSTVAAKLAHSLASTRLSLPRLGRWI